MKSTQLVMAAGICAAGMMVHVASAQTINYDATVNPINGTGNASTGWTTATFDNIQLGFMAEYDYPGYPGNAQNAPANPSDGNGTYLFNTGLEPGSTYKSTWDFWFDVQNIDPIPGGNLSAYNYYFTITPPGGTASAPVDFINALPDDAFGNSGVRTAYATGVGTGQALADENSEAENSENIGYFGLNATTPGLYQFTLTADYASGPNAGQAADQITGDVLVSSVPEPSSYAMAGLGLGGLVCLQRYRRKNA